MGWKIITDKSFNPDNAYGHVSQVGRESKTRNELNEIVSSYKGLDKITIRVGDDDGNHYYTARCDGDGSAEAFFDWSQYDSGCTWSEWYDKETKTWKGFIS